MGIEYWAEGWERKYDTQSLGYSFVLKMVLCLTDFEHSVVARSSSARGKFIYAAKSIESKGVWEMWLSVLL